VVFTAIPAYFQFRPETVGGVLILGDSTGGEDALDVAVEVEGPLVEVAGGECDEA